MRYAGSECAQGERKRRQRNVQAKSTHRREGSVRASARPEGEEVRFLLRRSQQAAKAEAPTGRRDLPIGRERAGALDERRGFGRTGRGGDHTDDRRDGGVL